jgi:hypothetical protein
MLVKVDIQMYVDVEKEFEREFMSWHDTQNTQNNNKIKDAILTGYFITTKGINEYYKLYYESNLKSICTKQHEEQLEKTKKEYESKLMELQNCNQLLETRLVEMSDRIKEHKQTTEQEIASFYEERKRKQIELIQLEKDKTIKELQGQVNVLTQQIDWQKETHERTIEVEVTSLKESRHKLEEQLSYFRKLAEDKDGQLQVAFSNETKERIDELQRVICQKDAELKALKSCNFVKGMTGENVIMSFLRERYPKHEVTYTGKIAHEGDIHFVNNSQQTLVVLESKYKQSITKDDVDKFYRDMSHVVDKVGGVTTCVGGVFISLLTRNIPSKGHICFEMLGNIPVMFIGFSTVDEFNIYFEKYFDMFNEISRFWLGVSGGDHNKQSSLEELMDEFNFYFSLLVKNKSRIEDFKNNCLNKINKFVGDIEHDNKMILDRVEGLLKKNNSMKSISDKGQIHTCEKCGELFAAKRQLTKHMKTCN